MESHILDFDKTPQLSQEVKDTFGPAIAEIRRRREFYDDFMWQDAAKLADGDRPLKTAHGQRYALLTVGTTVLAPRSLERRFPSLRVYGCFECKEDAHDHAEVVRRVDPACSLVVVECGEWFLFPQSEEVLASKERAAEALATRMAAYRAERAAEDEAFRGAVEDNVDRKVRWQPADWSQEQEEEAEAERAVYRRPRRLRAGGEVRGQTAVALCLVPDESDAGEVMVSVLGAFESIAEANEWAKDVATKLVTDHDIFIAPACEWLYPNGTRATTQSDHYRIKELQTIMDAAKANPINVRNFKEWKRANDAAKAQTARPPD